MDEKQKLDLIAKYYAGDSITRLSNVFNVSRDTIYRWIKVYQDSGNLQYKYKKGIENPNSKYPYIENDVLKIIRTNPNYSVHHISKIVGVSVPTVWKVLDKYKLRFVSDRNNYSNKFIDQNTIHNPVLNYVSYFTLVFILFFAFTNYWLYMISGIGDFIVTIALLNGMIFLAYSIKYYFSLAFVLSFTQSENKSFGIGLRQDVDAMNLNQNPFVSVHVALYNESNVIERLLNSVANFNYKNYEVVLADDSTDNTTNVIDMFLKKYLFKGEVLQSITGDGWYMNWVEIKPGIVLKHIHRDKRDGYKGGALSLALKLSNPKTSYISIFDADFVPYPDTLELFLKYFQVSDNQTNRFTDKLSSTEFTGSPIAAVQGYQWHVLNKSENWITRGVRSEYAGSYVVERSGAEIYGGLKQISGSVYMIKKEALESVGWGTSITEDFELTLKLYEKGFKVLYTPYVQAPAECVSTLKRLIRQRMRWAEGHSFNVKKMFFKLMFSRKLKFAEKAELIFLAPYYLQAFFFLVGTFAWLISETIFKTHLPFWTEVWGWSLVITNLISLPLLNGVGLFLEESDKRDFSGLASFVAISYIIVPFQAYAAIKGFIENNEGTWFRTPKTGMITDVLKRGRFLRFIQENSSYLNLTTSSKFDNFKILSSEKRSVGHLFTILLLVSTLLISYLSPFVGVYSPNIVNAYESGTLENNNLNVDDNLKVLNLHSHPKKGENWEVRFEVRTKNNLKIVPDDIVTDTDIHFVSLRCGVENIIPTRQQGNVVEFDGFECSQTVYLTNFIVNQGDHVVRLQFGKELKFAYNGSPATSTSNIATANSFQRKTWYDGSRYWSAFYSGSDIQFYYSSNNGSNWTQNSSATISVSTNDFSIYANSGVAYIAYKNGFDIETRKASTYPSTSFSWGSATITYDGSTSTNFYQYCTITQDTNGYLWVQSARRNSSTYTINARRSTNANDTSAWNTSTALNSSSNSNKYGLLIPRLSGNVFAIYIDGTAISSKYYTGSWGGAESIGTGTSGLTNTFSAVSDSMGDVHLLYINSSGNSVYTEYTSNWQTTVVLDSNAGNTSPTISLNSINNDVYAFWIRSDHIYYKKGNSPSADTNDGFGLMGDSGMDEYRADDNRGGSYASVTFNWVEQLAIYRKLNIGSWGTRAEPRRTGYEYNWSRSNAIASDLISQGQASGIAAQVSSGAVKNVYIQIGTNDFAIWNGTYAEIYDGTLTDQQVQDKVDNIVSDITSGVDTVLAAGDVNIVLADISDRGLSPIFQAQFPNASGRQRVTDAINEVNVALQSMATSRGIQLLSQVGLVNQLMPRLDQYGNINVAGEDISAMVSGDEPHHSVLADNEHTGTVMSGFYSNYKIGYFNDNYSLGLAPFTEAEMISHAGITSYIKETPVWDTNATDWQVSGTNTYLTSSYSSDGAPYVEWTSGAGSPYGVSWETLEVPEFLWLFFALSPLLPLISRLLNRESYR